MAQQTEGDIAWWPLPQREEWSVCPEFWLFRSCLRDEYLFSSAWGTEGTGHTLGRCLGAAESKKELCGMLLFLRTPVQKTAEGARVYQLLKKKKKEIPLIRNLHTEV